MGKTVGMRSKASVAVAVAGLVIVVLIAWSIWQPGDGDGVPAPTVAANPPASSGISPPATAPATPPDTHAAQATVRSDDESTAVMAEPFRSGNLPNALPPASGSADAAAATLADFIAARDDRSVPALLTAIMSAGFAVRHEDGRIEQTVTPGHGLAFEGWEVAAMAKLYGGRRTLSLQKLGEDLRLIPALANVPIEALLIDGISQHANGTEQHFRFWARLIVELGRRSSEPYDLLARPDPAAVQLDPVQIGLILRRLFGDFAAAGQRSASIGRAPRHAMMWASIGHPQPLHSASLILASLAQAGDPCSQMGKDDTATILDLAAVLIGTGWGQVLDAVNSQGADNLSSFLTVANTLLAYMKLLMTYASIETEITMDNPPLVRTTNATAGQRRQLTATVVMDSGGSDKYNCVRTALHTATGLDFSLIGDGPMADVELTWRVDNPGDAYYSNRTGITGDRPVVGITTGGPRIQDAGTSAGVSGAGTRIADPTRSKTDEEGRAHIYLEGAPRIPYLPPPHMPVMKQAVVRTNLKLKGGDVKGDAVDIAGLALGGVGAIATLPVELLFRIPWASVGNAVVEVKDWESCTRDEWYGTMVSTTRYEKKSVTPGESAEVVKTHASRYSHDATINVAGQTATAMIASEESLLSDNKSGYGRVTFTRAAYGDYSGAVNVSISANPQLGTYSVGFERPDLKGTSRSSGTCERPAPYKCKPGAPTSRPWNGDSRYLSSLTGKIDPNNPTVIRDSQTVERGDIKHTFSVNLERCK